jgi:hypothetical protein
MLPKTGPLRHHSRRSPLVARRLAELIGALGVFALLLLPACAGDRRGEKAAHRHAEAAHDSGYAGVQERGQAVMGVDQYTSTHVFEPLSDGGRIELQRDEADSAGTARIRQHLRDIAAAFAAGNFELPGLVHAKDVPGTAVMAAKRAAITYTVEELPRGGALRIQTPDTAAIRAIHEFLAFQRREHHAGAHHMD